jgi:PRTRC genetic system protein A
MDKKLALQKMIIGHYVEKVPKNCKKKLCYIMQGDGVWEIRRNKLGTFTTHVVDYEIPGLTSDIEEGWELEVPLIPADFLVKIVTFFKKINTLYDSEVFLQIFYDFKDCEYIIHCPKQRISGASVRYDNDDTMQDINKVLVLEIHSHNTMGAFFSSTDDADEKGDRFFGVVGRIDKFFPEIKLRLSAGGVKSDVEVDELFDIENDVYHTDNYPAEWLKNIKKETFKVKKFRGNRYQVYFPHKPSDLLNEEFDFMESSRGDSGPDSIARELLGQNPSDHRGSFYDHGDGEDEDEDKNDMSPRNWDKWRF